MYQVLFTIEYKNKIFTIFNTTYNRKTFLELNDKGEYIYPTIDDFIELHNIYNSRREVCYAIKLFDRKKQPVVAPLKPRTRVTFKEMVRTGTNRVIGIVLTAVLLINLPASLHNTEFILTRSNDDSITITIQLIEGMHIEDTNELDKVLGYEEVSNETIIEAINDNEKISDNYKGDAIKLLEYLTNKYPNCDMRIYYENIKRMEIIETGEEQYCDGVFYPRTGIINLYSRKNPDISTHELVHSSHNIIFEPQIIEQQWPIYKYDFYGFSLEEAYAIKITNSVLGSELPCCQQVRVLDYFLSCVPYSYYDYKRFGVKGLITKLEEKYPTVDINYIIESMDSITRMSRNGEFTLELEEVEPLMDTLFDICINNIDINSRDPFKPLFDLFKVIDHQKNPELFQKYFNYFRNILLEKGVPEEKILKTYDTLVADIRHNQRIKTEFIKYLQTVDAKSIEKDDLYANFRKFSEKINRRISRIEDVLDLLDIYNDFLYCNGFNSKQTINREDIESKVSDYQYLDGAVIGNDGSIYPYIEMDLENSTFRVLSENGKTDRKLTISYQAYSGFRSSRYGTTYIPNYFLKNFGEHEIGSEDFWYDLVERHKIDYKAIPIYFNGQLVGEARIKDLFIQIKVADDGSVDFVLRKRSYAVDGNGKPHSNSGVFYASPNVDSDQTFEGRCFESYVKLLDDYKERQSIELSEILNEEYLKNVVIQTSTNEMCSSWAFPELFYNSNTDEIEMHPAYRVCLKDYRRMGYAEAIPYYTGLSGCYFYDGRVYFSGHIISDDIGVVCEKKDISSDGKIWPITIPIEEVLRKNEMLDEEKEVYEFTVEEMCDLYRRYILELNGLKNSKPRGCTR